MTGTLRMSGQAFSGDTGAAADSRVRISRGLWGSSPSAGCKLSGAGFSCSGAELARLRLGSSYLVGPRDFCFAPLPLSTRGAPDGASAPVARVRWSTWPIGASAPLVRGLLFCFWELTSSSAQEIHRGEQGRRLWGCPVDDGRSPAASSPSFLFYFFVACN